MVKSADCHYDCDCPAFEILGPTEAVKNGTLQDFVVNAVWEPTYNWTVENGEIISGQGTRKLTVRVNKKDDSKEIKVMVELGASPVPLCLCAMNASASAIIIE